MLKNRFSRPRHSSDQYISLILEIISTAASRLVEVRYSDVRYSDPNCTSKSNNKKLCNLFRTSKVPWTRVALSTWRIWVNFESSAVTSRRRDVCRCCRRCTSETSRRGVSCTGGQRRLPDIWWVETNLFVPSKNNTMSFKSNHVKLWAYSVSGRHQKTVRLNNGYVYLHGCTFVQPNIGSW